MDSKEQRKTLKKVREFFRYRLTFWEHLSDRPPAHMKTTHSRKGRNALRKLGELLELENDPEGSLAAMKRLLS